MPSLNADSAVAAGRSSVMGPTFDGILNIHKPIGWTSHDVVARIRGLMKGPKVGHAGTLDPAATGVLPVLIGRATRIAEYLVDWDKEYAAVLRLGEATDTQDATGTILTTCSTEGVTESRVRAILDRFQGRLAQVPPMYSAVKIAGVPLYKAARAGRTVERQARHVTIHRLEMTSMAGRDVSLRVVCSKGTYVRTLCADIGQALGVGGHLLALERRRVGPLMITHALTMESLAERWSNGGLAIELTSLDEALHHLPAIVVDDPAAHRLIHGVAVPREAVHGEHGTLGVDLSEGKEGKSVRLKDQAGQLLAIGMMPEGSTQGAVAVVKVLVDVS
ncbi:MAG TPA: tRNA pseudouridine(55) synthase TruB [Nitrospiraceae bacterium]|nr:tRNA pseudouridine(55) synthase TruB [Nitrospiraceae bacterium]